MIRARLRTPRAARARRLVWLCIAGAVATVLIIGRAAWRLPRQDDRVALRHAPAIRAVIPPLARAARRPGAAEDNEALPRRYRASVDVTPLLDTCTAEEASSLEQYLAVKVGQAQCRAPAPMREFVCALQCDADEPELERAFRMLQTSRYTAKHLWKLCEGGSVSALVWIRENRGHVLVCGGRDHVQGRQLFKSTRRLISLLLCQVEMPDVLFALDNQDWAAPSAERSAVPGWIQPLPGVARYTGSPAHPSVLLPTNAFVKATTHCSIEDGAEAGYAYAKVCRHIDTRPKSLERPWVEREQTVFWRGSSTGVPLDENVEEYLPRPALVRRFSDAEGFDVGFVGGQPYTQYKPYLRFFEAHKRKSIPSDGYTKYKFVLHCDGHTASWGLAQKLTTRSAVVWIPSQFGYREFYYALLEPWKHYVPVDADLSNLLDTRDWLFTAHGDARARAIGEEARRLFETRLRPEATYCYLARLLASLAAVQAAPPTPALLERLGIPTSRFVPFEEYERQHPS